MKIISELTGLEYKTVAECEEAEAAYLAEQEEKAAKAAKLKEEKEARYEEIQAAKQVYLDLKKKFLEDYGYYSEFTAKDFTNDKKMLIDSILCSLFR
jgi:hypothetical protein